MAIIENFEVVVHVDNKPAREYDFNQPEKDGLLAIDPPGVVTKYIEAISGAPFSIEMKVLPQRRLLCDGLKWHISLDGEAITRQTVQRQEYSNGKENIITKHGTHVWKGASSKFTKFEFASLSIRECGPDELFNEKAATTYSELGTIKVELWAADKVISLARQPRHEQRSRAKVFAIIVDKTRDTNNTHQTHESHPDSVPETVLKGRGVHVSTGFHYSSDGLRAKRLNDQIETRASSHKRTGKKPLATFIFRYRTKQGLRDEGILARTPTLEERPLDSLSLAEALERLQRLEARIAEAEAKAEEKRHIKREASPDTPANPRPWKMIKTEEGKDAIDLDGSI